MTRFANSTLQPFFAMEILARAKALEAEGRDIVHLEVGEPGVPPAPRVIEAVRAALPEAQRYTNAKGQLELRLGLADYYSGQHGVVVDPERIVVTMGSSSAFILGFLGAF
ncbi:MAG: aminotransferase class I/II-fold pyridoxal phosphate-dependent enzyme, partial [Devosia sp.]